MPVPKRSATLTATIANGESLSGGVFMEGRILCGLYMPASWTAADLTFQASHDGATYLNVYPLNDTADTELTVQAAASRYLPLDAAVFGGARYVKVRSGTAGSAVNQGAARDIVLVGWEHD